MTQVDNIARADEIVGLTAGSGWAQMARGGYADDIRRTRYLKWLDENAADAARFSFRDDIARLAAGIVAAHAAKHPQPSDGLPPGPWVCDGYDVRDADNALVCRGLLEGQRNSHADKKIRTFIARCGSPAVRSILAACDDAELGRWSKIIDQYQIASACDAIVTAEFTTRGIGALPTGEITLFCGKRRK